MVIKVVLCLNITKLIIAFFCDLIVVSELQRNIQPHGLRKFDFVISHVNEIPSLVTEETVFAQ